MSSFDISVENLRIFQRIHSWEETRLARDILRFSPLEILRLIPRYELRSESAAVQ